MAQTQAVEENVEEQQSPPDQTSQEDSKTQAQSAEFSQAPDGQATGPGTSIDILLDMDVQVTVNIGQAKVPIQKLLQLGPGSVLRLDKPIDEPVELYLKETRFATGNIVVIEDRFAVKITEILGSGAN